MLKKDMPIPYNEWDCIDFSENVQQALEMLDEDPHYIEDHDHITEACELLECLTPEAVRQAPLSDEWKNDVLSWLFNAEVIAVARRYDVDHYQREELKEFCNEYIEDLVKEREKFVEKGAKW